MRTEKNSQRLCRDAHRNLKMLNLINARGRNRRNFSLENLLVIIFFIVFIIIAVIVSMRSG